MKHTLPIILLALVLVTACHSDQRQLARLHRAQTLIDTAPDTALALLDSIDSHSLMRADNALYALLMSQALDKNYIDITNDSLINIAVEHYTHSHNKYYKMLSYYYYGRVKYNAQEYAKSIVALLTAEKIAMELNDNYWMGKSCEQIANIYDLNFHHIDAIKYATKSYENLQHIHKQPYINYALLRLSRIYLNSKDYKNSRKFSLQVLDSTMIYNDEYLKESALRILAKSHYGNKDYIQAIETIQLIDSTYNLSDDLLCVLGICYAETNNTANYNRIYNLIKNDTTHYAKPLLYQFYHSNNDAHNALKALEVIYCELDSTYIQSLNNHFSTTIAQHFEQENKYIEEKLRKTKLSRAVIFVVFIISVFLLIFFFTKRYKKQQYRLDRNLAIAQNLQEIINFKNNDLIKAHENIRALLNSKSDIINNLCTKYFESKNTKKSKEIISAEVENLIIELSSDQQIALLEEQINIHLDYVIKELKEDLPQLKKQDYNLFIYSALGFSTTAITIFLNEEKIDSVYNRKARLKSKIKKLDAHKQSKYLKILQ